MKVSLNFTNELRILTSVHAFVQEALAQLPLDDIDARQLAALTTAAVEHAVLHAYPAGEEGSIQLGITEQGGKLELVVRDFGLPQDIVHEEQALHSSDHPSKLLFGCNVEGVVDEMHWLGFGPQGKAFQMLRWLHDAHVRDAADESSLTPFPDEPPLAPEQSYEIRRMRTDEAEGVSQLIYRAYGNTYFNEDVYYPDRVAAQNDHGALVSFVAVAADGEIVGHYALEFDQEGPVAEVGQAVVNPAHRQRGLLNRMKDAALDHARRLDLDGWFADAVCVHPYTQKSNVEHGGRLAAVELGIAPKTESFRGLTEQQTQRVSCMLYFHWLKPPGSRVVFVPARHRAIVERIYKNLDCPFVFGEAAEPQGHGILATKVNEGARLAMIRIAKAGADSAHAVLRARRQLVEHARVEAVFAELPLSDTGAPWLMEQLETAGFGFTGIAPHFGVDGDILRMAYHIEPLAREPIQVYEPFGEELLDYALSEQARVQANLE